MAERVEVRVGRALDTLAALGAEPRVTATIIPMAGRKGFDGMALAVVR